MQQSRMKKNQAPEKNKQKMEKPSNPAALPPLPPTIGRRPSMIAEPKTLLHDEMKLAREAALKIINSHSKEDALKIFMAGLAPVGTSSKQVKEDVVVSDCEDDEE